ncbi:hypothetical protein Agabi119p4_11438 [Agaricus bisporus var. burnettii]|uniref:Cysteine-rich protein 1 n=1 Tax=Agaricus bisporus var. burnettii TaxID=192524 RepID=A0A8H7EUB3_AGABI|nr:hypothetical protein Agabi119p4_11438 [Agaricus bisporus var. burnettii]
MHPFGGAQLCPRCTKAVYAAEQVMGPGRKLYHKPCLSCMICKKRLDSYSLVEHDQEPYCKTCYAKNFSTRDLRQANLPVREPSSNPSSPPRTGLTGSSVPTSPPRFGQSNARSPPSSPPKAMISSPTPKRTSFDTTQSHDSEDAGPKEVPIVPLPGSKSSPVAERPVPVHPSQRSDGISNEPKRLYNSSFSTYGKGTNTTSAALNLLEQEGVKNLVPKTTGTRYGAALSGKVNFQRTGTPTGGSPRKWGSESPHCPKCSQRVYFAEQVKAIGQTWHKNCLRCHECNTLLDSNRLRDHDSVPYCVRCYSKFHGPQGSGYALLGKAGG